MRQSVIHLIYVFILTLSKNVNKLPLEVTAKSASYFSIFGETRLEQQKRKKSFVFYAKQIFNVIFSGR